MKYHILVLCALLMSGCNTVKDVEVVMQPVLDEIPASSAREYLKGYTHVDKPTFGVCDVADGSISGYVKGAADPQGYRTASSNKWFVLQSTISVDESAGNVRTILRLMSTTEYLFCAVRMKTQYSANQGVVRDGGLSRSIAVNTSGSTSLDIVIAQERAGLEKALQALYVLGVKVK